MRPSVAALLVLGRLCRNVFRFSTPPDPYASERDRDAFERQHWLGQKFIAGLPPVGGPAHPGPRLRPGRPDGCARGGGRDLRGRRHRSGRRGVRAGRGPQRGARRRGRAPLRRCVLRHGPLLRRAPAHPEPRGRAPRGTPGPAPRRLALRAVGSRLADLQRPAPDQVPGRAVGAAAVLGRHHHRRAQAAARARHVAGGLCRRQARGLPGAGSRDPAQAPQGCDRRGLHDRGGVEPLAPSR